MNKILKKGLRYILLLSLAASASVVTAQTSSGPGWVTGKIEKVVVVSHGGVNVRLTPDVTGCVSQSGYGPAYASVLPSHPGLDKIYSGLLAAYMAGKQVSIYLSNSDCHIGEIEINGAR